MKQDDYVNQCRTKNPEMHVTENGIPRKLSQEEYDEAVEAWALMRWYQENPDQLPPAEMPEGL